MKPKNRPDFENVQSILNGGMEREKSLKAIYMDNELRAKIKRLCIHYTGSKSMFTELFHDTIITLDQNIRKNRFRFESDLSVYIYSIAKFLLLNRLRKESKFTKVKDFSEYIETKIDLVESPEEQYLKEEQKETIKKILDTLGPKTSKVLQMWQLSYSMQEIATELKLSSPMMARKIKFEGYRKLVNLIQEHNLKEELTISP